MAKQSNIEWTDSTFNPWIGCTKISPACDNCYAESWAKRFDVAKWGNFPRHRTSIKNWNNPRRWQKDAHKWMAEHGRPRFVFCASLADVFDNQVPKEWRDDLWELIRECDQLVWLLLTKRPQNIAKMLPQDWGAGWPHVWLGTTIENQLIAERNLPHLMAAPAAMRFASIEPMVGPIDLYNGDPDPRLGIEAKRSFIGEWWEPGDNPFDPPRTGLDWVIAGGESGKNARPVPADWFRSLRDQCEAAYVYFHFKQWGEYDEHEIRVGKKAAGRLLDGRTWDERPHPELKN